MMLSNLPIPLRAQLLALAALRMGKLRLAIFNPDEARDEHGRWISEGGFSSSPSDALVELGNGDKATVTKEDVRATVEKAYEQGIGPIDLTNLSVEGTPLFVGGLNRARDTMPQIPKEHQEAFLASMREKNISVTEGLVNPTTLLPTQNEIDAVRVGEKLHKYDEEKKTMRPIMVSKDNYVLDGHHRWATATIVAFDSPKAGVKIPVIRIGAKHEKALDLMLDYTKAHKISNRALASRPESAIHAAADKHQNAMTVAVMYAFLKGRKAYKSSGADAAVKTIHAALLVSLPPVLLKVVAAGGEVGLAKLKTRRAAASMRDDEYYLRTLKPQIPGQSHDTFGPLGIAFNVESPEAIAWAREHAGELAKDLSATSEQAIKDAVAAALEGDGVDAAYDDILDAIGDEARAEMIARTEVMTAANEGQRESWSQAVDAGLLDADAKKEWIATSEACPECDDLDGEVVGLDEEYPNDGGDGPPLHPNCRCTEGISA